jgi:cysteine synthase
VHRKTTAREIQLDFLDGIEMMVVGVGTGGHATAVGEFLKATFPAMTLLAVEPENSAVIGGGQPGPHRLQGLGAGFVPKNLNTEVLDGTLKVSDADALEWARRLAKEEGILGGISTGAVLAGLSQVIDKVRDGRNIVIFNYDTGERYLSIDDLFTA